MRNNFADELYKLSTEDERIVLLTGDIGNRLFDNMKEESEERIINCGIAEQSMMGIAAGFALSGLLPVVYTITPFTTYRCFEQIRVDVCYNNVPVVIVGTGAGLSYSTLGPTHHSMEDIAIMRALPGMTIFCPCDPVETRLGLRAAIKNNGPIYIRIGKKGEPVLEKDDYKGIVLGKAYTMREGKDICFIGTGPVLGLALKAADELKTMGISARVENFHTVKPMDTERLDEIAEDFSCIVVIEEHGKIGGLYSAIAEWYGNQSTKRLYLHSIGSKDEFLHKIGSQNFARQHYGITVEHIIEIAKSECGVKRC